MKILLFLCTIWRLIYINLSLKTVYLHVGTIDMSGHPYPQWYNILCHGCYGSHCKIKDVKVTLSKGDMTLSGLYGSGEKKTFCEDQPKIVTTGIKKCRILQSDWLDKALIKIDALEKCHNVSLIVRGLNVLSINIHPLKPDCECNPDGVKKDVFKPCNGYGICTCRVGYGGPKCNEPSAQEVEVADHKHAVFISVYCNGKCKIHYIRSTSTKYTDWYGSTKKFYVEFVLVSTDGEIFCGGELLDGVEENECKWIDEDEFDGDEFHIYAGFYRYGEKAKVQFDAENYLNHTVKVYDYIG